ncbi:hypothetical protein Rhopal_000139-T1 [Rhodotorula paludigena]|uniref:Protein kinase domain-containing protein n=1 Tax=Rhodotorula paludigena TaxID=86838 RepID=A0AAV5GBH5_9BASI|nr:hypothetical protein Rhopal_000139-T1 [Rhodotorula paludigena]
MPAPGEVDGETAIPFLSVVAAPDLAETLLKLGRKRLAECRRNPPPLSLPSGIARPLLESSVYLERRELQTFILGECRGTLDRCLTLILGEDWVVRHDTNADPPIITAAADGVARPDNPTRTHEGFCYKVEALDDETFCELRDEVVKTGTLPPLAIVGTSEAENSKPTKGEVRMWDEDAGQWITVPPKQASVLQISAIISSKRLRGEMCGLSPELPFVMPITNGSSIFYAISHFDEIDGKRYHRMAFSPVRALDFPIRLAHFANAQLIPQPNFMVYVTAWKNRSDPFSFFSLIRSSSPPLHLPPTGTFNFDGYLAARHDMTIYTSTSFPDLVFKFAVEGTEAGLELENEAITYSRLYNAAPCSASSFAVQYLGYYLCPDSCRVVLVLERGTPVNDVDIARQDVLELLNKAHAAGVVHGDVAPRNLVRTPRGLRLIDWGRARFAEGAAAGREDYGELDEHFDF